MKLLMNVAVVWKKKTDTSCGSQVDPSRPRLDAAVYYLVEIRHNVVLAR